MNVSNDSDDSDDGVSIIPLSLDNISLNEYPLTDSVIKPDYNNFFMSDMFTDDYPLLQNKFSIQSSHTDCYQSPISSGRVLKVNDGHTIVVVSPIEFTCIT